MLNVPNPDWPVISHAMPAPRRRAATAGPGGRVTARRAAAIVEDALAAGEPVTVIDLAGTDELPGSAKGAGREPAWQRRRAPGPATQVIAQMLDVVDRKVADQVDWARQDAEERMGVEAGDMAVLDDPVYDAVLALAAALHDLALSAAEVADAEAANAEARGWA